MKNLLLADYKKREYNVPESLEERFLFLIDKIVQAKEHNHQELYNGLLIVFHGEFDRMRIL